MADCWRTTLRFFPLVLYKVFAYLFLGRIAHTFDTHQPEELHGFRSKYRFEEHLLTANLFLDSCLLILLGGGLLF